MEYVDTWFRDMLVSTLEERKRWLKNMEDELVYSLERIKIQKLKIEKQKKEIIDLEKVLLEGKF
jgi:hypothetical protein